jgi:hypothetical protein
MVFRTIVAVVIFLSIAAVPIQTFQLRPSSATHGNMGRVVFIASAADALGGSRHYVVALLALKGEDGEENNDAIETSTGKDNQNAPSHFGKLIRIVFEFVLQLYSFAMIVLGFALSCGLLLNLGGYGYQFSLTDGVHIDTIKQFRIERQFQQEAKSMSQPSRSLPQ